MFAAAFKIRRFNRVYDHEVVGVGQGRVILRSRRRKRRRDARSRSRVRRVPRGFLYGLEWEGGYAHVRRLDTPGADSEFELIPVSGELRVGDLVRLDPCAFPRDPFVAHGMQFEEVRLQGELAPIPAWYVPGERDTWFIIVHGQSSWRGEALRLMPVAHSLGLPMLVISNRGGEDVPADPSRRYTYGVKEWRDLEAAVRFAQEHGARRVVLAGLSMGGSIVSSFLLRSEVRGLAAGAILDSPALDLRAAVEHQAAIAGLGPQRRWILLTSARLLIGIDWDSFDYLGRANEFTVPILLFHGDDDRDVPVQVSDEFARRRPGLVEYVRMPGVGHLLAWNADPAMYESRAKVFLERLLEQA